MWTDNKIRKEVSIATDSRTQQVSPADVIRLLTEMRSDGDRQFEEMNEEIRGALAWGLQRKGEGA